MFCLIFRINLATMILERTGLCTKISNAAGSLIWRVEVNFWLRKIRWVYFEMRRNEFGFMFQRLFFLNGEQDLSSFVLLDLGIIKYPTYKCIDSEPTFSNRTKLLAYEEVFLLVYIENKRK